MAERASTNGIKIRLNLAGMRKAAAKARDSTPTDEIDTEEDRGSSSPLSSTSTLPSSPPALPTDEDEVEEEEEEEGGDGGSPMLSAHPFSDHLQDPEGSQVSISSDSSLAASSDLGTPKRKRSHSSVPSNQDTPPESQPDSTTKKRGPSSSTTSSSSSKKKKAQGGRKKAGLGRIRDSTTLSSSSPTMSRSVSIEGDEGIKGSIAPSSPLIHPRRNSPSPGRNHASISHLAPGSSYGPIASSTHRVRGSQTSLAHPGSSSPLRGSGGHGATSGRINVKSGLVTHLPPSVTRYVQSLSSTALTQSSSPTSATSSSSSSSTTATTTNTANPSSSSSSSSSTAANTASSSAAKSAPSNTNPAYVSMLGRGQIRTAWIPPPRPSVPFTRPDQRGLIKPIIGRTKEEEGKKEGKANPDDQQDSPASTEGEEDNQVNGINDTSSSNPQPSTGSREGSGSSEPRSIGLDHATGEDEPMGETDDSSKTQAPSASPNQIPADIHQLPRPRHWKERALLLRTLGGEMIMPRVWGPESGRRLYPSGDAIQETKEADDRMNKVHRRVAKTRWNNPPPPPLFPLPPSLASVVASIPGLREHMTPPVISIDSLGPFSTRDRRLPHDPSVIAHSPLVSSILPNSIPSISSLTYPSHSPSVLSQASSPSSSSSSSSSPATVTTLLPGHGKVDAPPKPFICDRPGCGRSFGDAPGLTRHITVTHGPRLFACKEPECGRRFNDAAKLRRHMQMHANIAAKASRSSSRAPSPTPTNPSPSSSSSSSSSSLVGEISME